LPQRIQNAFRPFFATCLIWVVALMLLSGPAAAQPIKPSKDPVNFQSKQLSHDETAQTVTAIGDVELTQGQKILRADKMVYHLDTDTVQAIGNVSLLDDEGDVHFAEYVELTKDMKNGFVQGLLSLLADGSRFTATEGRRENGTKTTMTDAAYTACRVCEADPRPLWQIRADKVVHDETDHSVSYKNARLEFAGVPLAFAPIFSHADPSVKRKSGFLRPTAGFSSRLGTFAQGGYYWNIRPEMDATLQLKPTTLEGVLAQLQWRERFKNGRIEFDFSGAKSDRKEEDGTTTQDVSRGSVFGNGLFDLSNTWRAGFNLQRVSDKEFLRLYDISKQNVLDSDIYAERFSGRDYTRVSAITFEDVRLGPRPKQPDVLPMLDSRFIGEPAGFLGGRWSFGGNILGLRREASAQDVHRASLDLGWQRRDIFASGLASLLSLQGRGDFYDVRQSDAAKLNPLLDPDTQKLRGMGVASAVFSYPLVRHMSDMQLMIEPIAGVSVSPRIDEDDTDIPNEDSIDTELDANNLFSDNRFPGIDRQEDGARANYGVRIGGYGDNGRYAKAFIGHSYRFQNSAAFPIGSGLENHSSDVVGQIDVGLSKYLNGDYRFQVDNNLTVRRHELQAVVGNDTVSADTRYIYIDNIAGTGFTEPRQQVQFGGKYHFRTNWWVTGDTLTDMGEEPGLRKASFSLNYADECFSFTAEGVRNLLTDVSGDGGTVLLMRVGFKNIGEFSAPNIQLTTRDSTTQ
jgi:LPS-assembly protein